MLERIETIKPLTPADSSGAPQPPPPTPADQQPTRRGHRARATAVRTSRRMLRKMAGGASRLLLILSVLLLSLAGVAFLGLDRLVNRLIHSVSRASTSAHLHSPPAARLASSTPATSSPLAIASLAGHFRPSAAGSAQFRSSLFDQLSPRTA